MSDLDEQRKKRPGNRDHIDQIKTEMSREVLRDPPTMSDLHAKITMVLAQHLANERYCLKDTVDAIIKELDMGIPCATTGCRMRQIARRHSDKLEE
jgi:hypothetical protein